MTAISIVIPTAGAADGLACTLDALDRQSIDRSQYEVIVVDNNQSSHHSLALDAMLAERDIRQVRAIHPGAGAARNAGATIARGELLLFVDDDVDFEPGFVEAHLRAHERAAEPVVVVGAIDEHNHSAEWFRRYLIDRRVINRRLDPATVGFKDFYGANTSLPHGLFVEAGGFDEGFRRREDAELGYRLESAGVRFVAATDARVRHHSRFGPRDHLRRARLNGYYLAMLIDKHPDVARYEKMRNYRLPMQLLAMLVAGPLLLVGAAVYRWSPQPLYRGLTALTLIQNSRGFARYRRGKRI